jgi:hypothetical protein
MERRKISKGIRITEPVKERRRRSSMERAGGRRKERERDADRWVPRVGGSVRLRARGWA